MFHDVNFMYGLYHDCARTLKRSLTGKLAIVKLSSDFGFACNSSKTPCTLASFLRARMPRGACTRDITCELYCIQNTEAIKKNLRNVRKQRVFALQVTFITHTNKFSQYQNF